MGKFLLAQKWVRMAEFARPFVRYDSVVLRIGSAFFSLFIYFFFIFCMNLRDHKYSKLWEPSFLREFLLTLKYAKMTQNASMTLDPLGGGEPTVPPPGPQLHFCLLPFPLIVILLKKR